MKKTLRSILAGALALLAVSCYDDEALRKAIANLESEVAALKTSLNTEVNTLNSKIDGLDAAYKLADQGLTTSIQNLTSALDALDGQVDGLIASYTTDKEALLAKIEELKAKDEQLAGKDAELLASLVAVGVTNVAKNQAGNVVLTFTDGSTLEIPTKPQEGLVTVIEVDAVKYWAVVVNGEPQSLGVKVGHPSLEFEVDAETNELLFSVDGGEFEGTGAYVAADQAYLLTDFYQGAEFDYDLWEEVVDDYYTLVFGGVEYQLPLYKVDNSVVTIKAGKTYFTYGESKSIEVALTDVKNCYVMSKPDGWRANLEGKVLTVKAPSEAAIASDVAEANGEVLLHCNTIDGKCKIARLAVATTPGFSLTVDAEGNVTIVNPNVVTTTNRWGEEVTDFEDAFIGLAPVSAFEADIPAYLENAPYDYENVTFMLNVWKGNTMDWETGDFTVGGAYVPGEYEVDVINTSVEAIYSYMKYSAVPAGSNFVVWACPVDEMGSPKVDELVFGYYNKPVQATITAEADAIGVTDIELTVNVDGATNFYVGLLLDEYTYGMPIDSYMKNQEGPFGYFQMALQYGMPEYAFQYMGTLYQSEGETLKINASELNYGSPLLPNTKFYAWVFPIIEGYALESYTYEDNLKPYICEFTTSGVTAGGSLVPTLGEAELEYTAIRVGVSAPDAMLVYYNYYDVEEYNEITDVAADLLVNGYVSGEAAFVAAANNLSPKTSKVLAVMAVDATGKYGEVVFNNYTSLELVYSESFVATVGDPQFEVNGSNWKVTMPVTVTGGEAAKYYYYWNTSARTPEQLNTLPLQDYYYYYDAAAIPQLVYYNYYSSYQFAVVVESTTGELSAPVIVTVNKPAAE